MEGFLTGNVAPPIRPEKLAPRAVLFAQRQSMDGPFEPVYVKILPINERCIEAVCAWLAREINLPAPEPLLLNMRASRMPRGGVWPFGNKPSEMCFATREVPYARALQVMTSDHVGSMLDRWKRLADAAVFDLLIANDDRTAGNILVGPTRDLWLIDHARSLGGGSERLFSSAVPISSNFFLSRIASYAAQDRVRLRPDLIAVCTKLVSAVKRIPYAALLVPEDIAMQINDFLSRRAHMLQAMVLQTIGLPDLYSPGDRPASLQ